MATLNPDRDLPGFPPQTFNVTAPGTMRPQPADPDAGSSYGQQMGNVGGAFMNGLGAALKFLFNAPGGGGPLDANRMNGTAAAATAPAVTPPTPVSGGPDRPGGPAGQAMPAAPTIAAPAPAARRVSATRAPAAAAAPAAEALVPGETGYYLNGDLVPYGQMQSVQGGSLVGPSGGGAGGGGGGGGGGGSAGGMPGGGALIDPRDYFPDVVGQQLQYSRRAASDILSQAGSGSELGYSARLRALASVYLNGLAGVGQGGANTFNSATAGIINQGTASAASRYAADRGLTGTLAHAGATVHATDVGAETAADQHAIEREKQATDTQQTGGDVQVINGVPVVVPTFTTRKNLASMPTPYETKQASKPKEGATGTLKDGRRFVIKDGQPVVTD